MKAPIKPEETSSLQESSSKEYCFNKKDVISSETALRIIQIIEQKNYKNQEQSINKAFDNFSYGYPISKEKKDKLISFFKDEKNINLWKKLFSKVFILIWDNNHNFINQFLKNSEGKNDIKNFVNYVIEELENYPFIIENNYDEIKEIKNWNDNPETKTFKYRKWNKRWLIITKNTWETYVLENKYEKLEYRRNWTFCWITKDEKWYYWEYIRFDWQDFKVIWRIDDIKNMPNLSDTEWNLIYETIWWKNWLNKFEDDKEKGRLLAPKIPPEYNSIIIKNWLILASKNLEWNKQSLEIFWKKYEKLMIFEDIEDYKAIEWMDIIRFKTATHWYSYYEINSGWEVKEIDFLQNVQSLIRPDKAQDLIKNYILWKPIFIKYKQDKPRILIKDNTWWILWYDFNSKVLNISITDIWLDKKSYITYDINWTIYIFDTENNIFFKSNKRYKSTNPRTLNEIKKDLEQIPLEKINFSN